MKKPLGTYSYWKRLSDRFVSVVVTVYMLPVAEELPPWEEKSKRKRAWLKPGEAAKLIDEPELATLVLRLAELEPGKCVPSGRLPTAAWRGHLEQGELVIREPAKTQGASRKFRQTK